MIETARDLRSAGKLEEAMALLRREIAAGDISAMVELAEWLNDAGNRRECESLIDQAEKSILPGDHDGHMALHSAYSMGLGGGEHDHRLALVHLEQVAQLENPVAQLDLALQYQYGLNECEKDDAKFLFWVNKAIENGYSGAAGALALYLVEQKQRVPEELVAVLEEAAASSREAAAHLKKVRASNRALG